MEMPLDTHAFVSFMFPHCNCTGLYTVNVLFWANAFQGHWQQFINDILSSFLSLVLFKKASYLCQDLPLNVVNCTM